MVINRSRILFFPQDTGNIHSRKASAIGKFRLFFA
jgi:hypothetical protein